MPLAHTFPFFKLYVSFLNKSVMFVIYITSYLYGTFSCDNKKGTFNNTAILPLSDHSLSVLVVRRHLAGIVLAVERQGIDPGNPLGMTPGDTGPVAVRGMAVQHHLGHRTQVGVLKTQGSYFNSTFYHTPSLNFIYLFIQVLLKI